GRTHAHRRSAGKTGGSHREAVCRPGGGKLLDGLLSGIGLSRDDVFIANIVKHRPPGNRDPPGEEEIRACTPPYLEEQIRIVGPKVIVMLGRHSSRYILSFLSVEFDRITEIRGGTVYPGLLFGHPVRLIPPTLHPAAALYNPGYRESLEEDFRIIGANSRRPESSRDRIEEDHGKRAFMRGGSRRPTGYGSPVPHPPVRGGRALGSGERAR
ncbi:uracil-DNA glycosylase, partial [Methanoculleus chikugoensis]|uniref:uracil-DNA glycosylase n=1 Tax=Methanoculleus chikugoensis TaxID=118126 RepID=UPI000ACFE46A